MFFCAAPLASPASDIEQLANQALLRAGENRGEIERALADIPAKRREGMTFLVAYMPDHDLTSLSADFLLENVNLAYDAFEAAPWRDQVPHEIFLNDVLPYACVNERRDNWRKDFHERFSKLVTDIPAPGLAAAKLNNEIFNLVNVHYSTDRPKPDQSPYESIACSKATCTGLAILLIDACRAVGVPARFAGCPLWTDESGNHSWVEVWDDGWHLTGADEPTGNELDKAWFVERASSCQRDHPLHAVFATSWRRTPISFPLVWDREIDYVWAINVTDRYTAQIQPLLAGQGYFRFQVRSRSTNRRVALPVTIMANQKVVFNGTSNDESFDMRDHLTATLQENSPYTVIVNAAAGPLEQQISTQTSGQVFTLWVDDIDETKSTEALAGLRNFLEQTGHDAIENADWQQQEFVEVPLTRAASQQARDLLWNHYAHRMRRETSDEFHGKCMVVGESKLPFDYKVFGEKPTAGHSLYIAMHGGGGAPAEVNDQQYERHQTLYQLDEGIYLCPRAPSNTWNMWHTPNVDLLFERLITAFIVHEGINPNRVYLTGYSAGGDGVYQLAPRLADHWAATAMMAGHPNDAKPFNLRNLPFTLHMGANDEAYNRNKVAAEWKDWLMKLREQDPDGYEHWVKIHAGKGHWMELQDAAAIPWMAKFTRNPLPTKVVWRQQPNLRERFYWLAVHKSDAKPDATIVATYEGQCVNLAECDPPQVTLRLDDRMLDLDQPIKVTAGRSILFEGMVPRTMGTLQATILESGDPQLVFAGRLTVETAEY